jgi:hypothetical protein
MEANFVKAYKLTHITIKHFDDHSFCLTANDKIEEMPLVLDAAQFALVVSSYDQLLALELKPVMTKANAGVRWEKHLFDIGVEESPLLQCNMLAEQWGWKLLHYVRLQYERAGYEFLATAANFKLNPNRDVPSLHQAAEDARLFASNYEPVRSHTSAVSLST